MLRDLFHVHFLIYLCGAQAVITCQIDPKLSLPQFVINFVMQKLAGVLLYILTKQALRISGDSENTLYADKIRSNVAFYVDWLLPKFRNYMTHQGWEQPIIRCLGEHGGCANGSDVL